MSVQTERDAAADRGGGPAVAPPPIVIAIAIAAMWIGFFVTPEFLAGQGILGGLVSTEARYRNAALNEVRMFRIFCLCLAMTPYFWGWLTSLTVTRRIVGYEPREGEVIDPRGDLFNFSLAAGMGGVAAGLFYAAFGARFFTKTQLLAINSEDGAIEDGTALAFLLCSVFAAILTVRRRRQGMPVAMLAVLAAVFFLGFGEEISWGQRIFGIKTLDAFKNNWQNENNLHNLSTKYTELLAIVGVFAYGTLLPVLAWRFPYFRGRADATGLPVPSLGLAVVFLAISCLHGWTVERAFGSLPGLRTQELRELLCTFGFLLMLIEVWRRTPAPSRLPLRRRWRRLAIGGAAAVVAAWLGASFMVGYVKVSRRLPPVPEPAPQVAWAKFEELRLRTVDGEEIGGWFAEGRDDAPSVLFLDSNGGRDRCLPRAEQVAGDLGCAVMMISMRAHGDSSGRVNDLGFSARKDVVAAVDFLERRRPGRSIVVVGSTLGATAAAFAAEELDGRVAGYVLESPNIDMKTAVRNRTRAALPAPLAPLAYMGLRIAYRAVLPNFNAIAPGEAIAKVPENVPVLVMAGETSRTATVAEAEAFVERIQTHARLETFPGANHDNLMESDPERYRRLLVGFVSEAARGR